MISQQDISNCLYCTAHDGWYVTGYQGLFCPLNKPVIGLKGSGPGVLIVEIGHFDVNNRGNLYHLVTVFKVITLLRLTQFHLTILHLTHTQFRVPAVCT